MQGHLQDEPTGHLSSSLSIKEIAEMVEKAVREKPIRSEHYDTGKAGFFIVGDEIYTWNDWREIPAHKRSSAIPVHSHSGIGAPPWS